MKDIKPLFKWALQHGESKVVDRILIKLLPEFLSYDLKITPEFIGKSNEILVPESLYPTVKQAAEELVNLKFTDSV